MGNVKRFYCNRPMQNRHIEPRLCVKLRVDCEHLFWYLGTVVDLIKRKIDSNPPGASLPEYLSRMFV